MRLLRLEMRRALHRKAVRWLILVALVGIAFFGVIVWFNSANYASIEMSGRQESPALMRTWWRQDRNDGLPVQVAFFLIFGGVICGATVAGAEWKANTITSLLVSEPRRIRVLSAKLGAAAILAFLIAFALQVVLMAAALPSVFAHGSTEVSGSGWWLSLGLAIARTALVTAIAAVLAEAIATIGRNTVVGLVVLFGWLAVVEGFTRGLRPGWTSWLWGENIATIIPWREMGSPVGSSPIRSLTVVGLYTLAICISSIAVFNRRDIAGGS